MMTSPAWLKVLENNHVFVHLCLDLYGSRHSIYISLAYDGGNITQGEMENTLRNMIAGSKFVSTGF